MLLMIDNYDSFTYNLVQYFGELGEDVQVFRNNKITIDEIKKMIDILLNFDIKNYISSIKCPLLYIIGEKDIAVDPSTAILVKELNKNAETKIIQNADHTFLLTTPSVIVEDLIKFTSRLSLWEKIKLFFDELKDRTLTILKKQ